MFNLKEDEKGKLPWEKGLKKNNIVIMILYLGCQLDWV